jgi:hypothetical protein
MLCSQGFYGSLLCLPICLMHTQSNVYRNMGPNANKDGCSHIIRSVKDTAGKYGSTQSADLYCVTSYIVSVTLASVSETPGP